MLSDLEIEESLRNGELVIEEFEPGCMRPSSYLLRLDDKVFIEKTDGAEVIDTKRTDTSCLYESRRIETEGFLVEPRCHYLAPSLERVSLSPGLSGILGFISSMARAGISANAGSMLVAATFGYRSPTHLVFEFTNISKRSIVIYPRVKFCHLCLFRHGTLAKRSYSGIYGRQGSPVPADFARRPSQ